MRCHLSRPGGRASPVQLATFSPILTPGMVITSTERNAPSPDDRAELVAPAVDALPFDNARHVSMIDAQVGGRAARREVDAGREDRVEDAAGVHVAVDR